MTVPRHPIYIPSLGPKVTRKFGIPRLTYGRLWSKFKTPLIPIKEPSRAE